MFAEQYGLVQTVAPTTEPLTVAEAKQHLRVRHAAEDTLISGIISAARLMCETRLHKQLVTATWVMKMDTFPRGTVIRLPRPPLQSVTSVTYLDELGASQTLSASYYDVDTYSLPGRICLRPEYSWPGTENGRANAVTVTYVAGYGAAATIPPSVKSAMLLLIGHLYANREAVVSGVTPMELPLAVDALLAPESMIVVT